MKKIIALMLALVLVFALAACGGAPAASKPTDAPAVSDPTDAPAEGEGDTDEPVAEGDKIVLKACHVVDPNHPYHHGLLKMSEYLEEKTNGRITIEVYHSSQLGNERDSLEGMIMGSLDLCAISTAPVSSFVPEIAVFDLPYLFRDRDHAFSVVDGPIGEGILDKLEAQGIIGLGYFENGWRHVTNSIRPITKPEDMKGLKIRVMESPVPIATFNALGANATPMAWGEVFTALQQGTIDAQENPLTVIYGQRLYEVQKYLSLTEHVYAPALLLMSQITMDSLSAEDQALIWEAAAEGIQVERDVSLQQSQDYLELCREEGMEINEIEDKQAFIDAMAPVYEQAAKDYGQDIIDAIVNTK